MTLALGFLLGVLFAGLVLVPSLALYWRRLSFRARARTLRDVAELAGPDGLEEFARRRDWPVDVERDADGGARIRLRP